MHPARLPALAMEGDQAEAVSLHTDRESLVQAPLGNSYWQCMRGRLNYLRVDRLTGILPSVASRARLVPLPSPTSAVRDIALLRPFDDQPSSEHIAHRRSQCQRKPSVEVGGEPRLCFPIPRRFGD